MAEISQRPVVECLIKNESSISHCSGVIGSQIPKFLRYALIYRNSIFIFLSRFFADFKIKVTQDRSFHFLIEILQTVIFWRGYEFR